MSDPRMLCTNCGRDVTGVALTAPCPNCNRRGKRFAGKREMWSCLTVYADKHIAAIKELSWIDQDSGISAIDPNPALGGRWTNIFAKRGRTK